MNHPPSGGTRELVFPRRPMERGGQSGREDTEPVPRSLCPVLAAPLHPTLGASRMGTKTVDLYSRGTTLPSLGLKLLHWRRTNGGN